jgi:shikimate dehydrogenase
LKLAIIGDPLRQSVSDFLHGWVYAQLGLEAEYKKYKVSSDELEHWLETPKVKKMTGFNVTIPHKESIIPFLDGLNDRTAALKAVNCVRRQDEKLIGYNTDWYGFVKSMEQAAVDLSGQAVVILGSGGAARAVAFGASRMGASQVTVVARTRQHGNALVKDLKPAMEKTTLKVVDWNADAVDPIEKAYCLVNCTPVGMKPNVRETPIDAELLESVSVVMDTIFNPLNTRLLSEAIFADCQTVSGLDMLLFQAMASIDIWFGAQDWDRINMNTFREAVHNKITGFKRKFE